MLNLFIVTKSPNNQFKVVIFSFSLLYYYHFNTYVSPDNTEYCCQGAVVCIFVYFTFLCNSYYYRKKKVNILNNTRANFEIVENLYNELLSSVGINLHVYFRNLDIDLKRKTDTDLINNNYFTWDPNETFVQSRILATYRDFFYDTGHFLGRNALIRVPMANMPHFINANDWISPRSLYETYVGRNMQGLTSVQFFAAFNRFLGGDKEISRNAMREFFHNLSWQALTNDNDFIKIEFTAITELVKSINLLLQKKKI